MDVFTKNRTREEWLQFLHTASRKQLRAAFRAAAVPRLHELEGEFQGLILDQGSWLGNLAASWCINRRGRWLGKAFQPQTKNFGRGYNIFRTSDGIERTLPMQFCERNTSDGRQLTIEYGADHSGIIGSICDEMKRLAPGLFLGLGTVYLGGRLFPWLYVRVVFAIIGPTGDVVPDAILPAIPQNAPAAADRTKPPKAA